MQKSEQILKVKNKNQKCLEIETIFLCSIIQNQIMVIRRSDRFTKIIVNVALKAYNKKTHYLNEMELVNIDHR